MHWPDKVRLMQENWIGKSRGMKFRFALDPEDKPALPEIEVYTTRPDTIFGASFVAVSPDHPLAAAHAASSPEVAAFIARCKQGGTTAAELETAEKLGLEIAEVIHPLDPDWTLARLHRELRADGLRHRRHFRRAGARPARL